MAGGTSCKVVDLPVLSPALEQADSFARCTRQNCTDLPQTKGLTSKQIRSWLVQALEARGTTSDYTA